VCVILSLVLLYTHAYLGRSRENIIRNSILFVIALMYDVIMDWYNRSVMSLRWALREWCWASPTQALLSLSICILLYSSSFCQDLRWMYYLPRQVYMYALTWYPWWRVCFTSDASICRASSFSRVPVLWKHLKSPRDRSYLSISWIYLG